MAGNRGSILIDARVNALPGAHGLARSVMKLVAQMPEPGDGLALRVLVNPREEQPGRAARTGCVPGGRRPAPTPST